MAGDDSAKRAEEEGNTQGCPGEHLSDLWVRLRSRLDEVRSEHDSCGLSVNQEVIKLDGRTHESSREHLTALLGIIRDDRSSHKNKTFFTYPSARPSRTLAISAVAQKSPQVFLSQRLGNGQIV